jgi:ubiquinone/menaquinone biosynthesis C-methylase UbiE
MSMRGKSAHPSAANLRAYNAPDVVKLYASLDYLTPCEQLLFSTCIKPGSAILDVGVGGGRTTAYLSKSASRYAGVDYSEAMIRICRERFPDLDFLVTDASDLSAFEDGSFDAIVMAFNAIDYVLPQENRWAFLRECRRLLRPGGTLIFSSHNPRAILVLPAWNKEKLKAFARRYVAVESAFFRPFLFALMMAKAPHSLLRAAGRSVARIVRRMTKPAFWRGEGTFVDSAHGGLVTHYWVPKAAIAELTRFGFQVVRWMGDDYPRAGRLSTTDWYYYVSGGEPDVRGRRLGASQPVIVLAAAGLGEEARRVVPKRKALRGCSSVGRAPRLQRGCQEFESPHLHHFAGPRRARARFSSAATRAGRG